MAEDSVCLLFDSVAACDQEALDVLAAIGVYQYGIMRESIENEETVAHIVGLHYSPKLLEAGEVCSSSIRPNCW
jgi:hypothetical protein